ncbi:MAG: NUDIX hydrolase [Acidimicrobiia bacterium]|nr:NUDIX hydrolase [Acidimicrobiia bacterium]
MEEVAGLRRWRVASGVVMVDGGVLLVANRRRNGDVDWSTPGGVIDPGETALAALTREVFEETGVGVTSWSDLVYQVEVVAPDHGFHLEVSCHQASEFTGSIRLDDPDGIVIAAEYVAIDLVAEWLVGSPPWVAEPLIEYLDGKTGDRHHFRYRLTGGPSGERRVLRLHDG